MRYGGYGRRRPPVDTDERSPVRSRAGRVQSPTEELPHMKRLIAVLALATAAALAACTPSDTTTSPGGLDSPAPLDSPAAPLESPAGLESPSPSAS